MATAPIDGRRPPATGNDLLLQETNHRCSNDLQLVVSLLALQSRRAANPEVAQALNDAMERVAVLARARRVIHGTGPQGLNAALRQVCEALHAQAEPRSIVVAFQAGDGLDGLSDASVTTLALVVNELATNAIKHAFAEGTAGNIRVSVSANDRNVVIIVDDDGLPFPTPRSGASGMGMGLARRMMASIDGLFIPPEADSKIFELRTPVGY